jgi:hypothetical protein
MRWNDAYIVTLIQNKKYSLLAEQNNDGKINQACWYPAGIN